MWNSLQWGHGIAAVESRDDRGCPHREPGFNGATALLPWNQCSGRYGSSGPAGFNGATALLPWNHGWQSRPGNGKFGFNGATALLPWNRDKQAIGATGQVLASMGPRHCCRGIALAGYWRAGSDRRFNGATALLPWNPSTRSVVIRSRGVASMGPRHCCRGIFSLMLFLSFPCAASMGPRHCCRGIRNPERLSFSRLQHVASMGPRHCCRGIEDPMKDVPHVFELQWGHGIAAVESTELSAVNDASTALQWGHGIAAVESSRPVDDPEADPQASMGPRHCCRGILRGLRLFHFQTPGFNGATALLPWNPSRAKVAVMKLYTWLQWGHGIAAVES